MSTLTDTRKSTQTLRRVGLVAAMSGLIVGAGFASEYALAAHFITGPATYETLPGVVASDDFKTKLKTVDPKLTEFAYAPESYDAVVLTALAAEAAKDDSGTAIGSKLVEVSKGGTKCTTFEECVKLVKAGTDIDYDGVSGPVEFSEKGDPTEATIGIYQYGAKNTYTFLEGKEGKL